MKIIIARNAWTRPGIRTSSSGAHLKRSLGGPPWWRHFNGFSIATRTTIYFIEFWKPSSHRKGLIVDWRVNG